MKCKICSADNEAINKFCSQCGASLLCDDGDITKNLDENNPSENANSKKYHSAFTDTSILRSSIYLVALYLVDLLIEAYIHNKNNSFIFDLVFADATAHFTLSIGFAGIIYFISLLFKSKSKNRIFIVTTIILNIFFVFGQ